MDVPVNFKYDVRIRARLLAKGQVTEAEVTKHLESLADLEPGMESVDLPQPAIGTIEHKERPVPIPRPVVARPIAPAPVRAPIALEPAADIDEDWDDEDEDEDEDEEIEEPAAKAAPAATAAAAPAKIEVEAEADEEDSVVRGDDEDSGEEE